MEMITPKGVTDMYQIHKITLGSPVDYAAEELKKYLRMMMPECSEISIDYAPDAVDGFRLGLMQDFGLDVSDAEDPVLDDILYVDADACGGIIAGDNPRSVLLAVYEYLRRQGCRWLFPGVDGEFIPVIDAIAPVSFRHKPSCRYRGQCNEGSEYQSNMLEAIEFTPKVGMNVFMMEFRIPTSYYRRYYTHMHNEENRPPEPVSNQTILQWKRQCEAELSRRGLQFHDMGHGWSADPFGIDSSLRASDGDNDAALSDESRQFLALVDGKRALIHNTPNYTQFCMSNPVAREKLVKYAADYAQTHNNVDYLHLWLGDALNKQCECEHCREKTPSDWYMILLNELDDELTRRKLDTRIVFIVYVDTVWPPETEKIINPARFTLLLAPISRRYTESVPEVSRKLETQPYVRNKLVLPKSLEENFAYFEKWKENWKGANVAYEYHFWRHQYYDIAGLDLADVVNRDVKAYKKYDVNGIIQDGSQRSFFPTGLVFYVYARTLYDNDLNTEELIEEYFSCAFGEDWKAFRDYLRELGDAVDFRYLEGQLSADPARSRIYNPAHAESLARVEGIVERGLALIHEHYNMPYRVQTASVRLLEMHANFARMLAAALIPKSKGDDDTADRLFAELVREAGKMEVYFQTCYDHGLAIYSLKPLFDMRTQDPAPQIY
ncbi:MAG: DUF4838 domain-containing protein [Anaerofustis stercorihominis]|nr:DUF4838 domain-containing protein [Anaerofustis stercorihominis]